MHCPSCGCCHRPLGDWHGTSPCKQCWNNTFNPMIPESVTIILPLPAKVLSPNWMAGSIGGRFAKAAAAKKYRKMAKIAVEAERIEDMPWQEVEVKAVFYYRHKRRRDQDNAMGSLKAAYDGIVDAGLVIDDDYEHMKRVTPAFELDPYCPRIALTITRLQ